MKTGKMRVEFIPERRFEQEERICDICSGDATSRAPCSMCKKDLCSSHQIDVHGVMWSGIYGSNPKIEGGLYCKECLLAAIRNTF